MVINLIERLFSRSTPSWEKAAQGNDYRLLLINTHAHLSPSIVELFIAHRVIPYCLPNIRRLQPLDASTFGQYKNELKRLWKEADSTTRDNKFYDLLVTSRKYALSTSNVQNGFWNAGIIPIDPSKVLPGAAPLPRLETSPPHERRPLEPLILELQRSCSPLSLKSKREFDDEVPKVIMDLEKNLMLRTAVAKLCDDNQRTRADLKRQETRTQLLEILKRAKEENHKGTPMTPRQTDGERSIILQEHNSDIYLQNETGKAIETPQGRKRDSSGLDVEKQSIFQTKKQKAFS